MSTTKLFEKHFGNTAFADIKHPNMESFFKDLNAECLKEDKHIKCTIHSVSQRSELVCDHEYVYKILYDHTAADVCIKCGNIKKQTCG